MADLEQRDPIEDIHDAWRRVFADKGLPGDGIKLLIWLRRELMALPAVGASDCAVRELEGRRRFASELIRLATDQSTSDRARTDADAADARTDSRFAGDRARFRAAVPGSDARARGAARRGNAAGPVSELDPAGR